ncbi:MAG: ATP-binding protein [Bacteroidales bacterium]|nr:ATP-binding protein [Bacteroidales bacterium]
MVCCTLLDTDSQTACSERKLVMRNDIADIALLADFVEKLSEESQLPMDAGFKLNLALEEAVSNVMKYAYPEGEEHEITLTVKIDAGKMIFELSDTGKPFDPTMTEAPDVTLSAEERSIGGLGIFLVKNIMQSVEYHRVGNRNILVMKYKL